MNDDRRVRATIRKEEILRGKKDFQAAFASGRRIESQLVVALVTKRQIVNAKVYLGHRVGFVVRRTVRRAVDRNRIKRLLREAYRRNKSSNHSTPTPHDLVLMYSPKNPRSIRSITYQEIEQCVKKILSAVTER